MATRAEGACRDDVAPVPAGIKGGAEAFGSWNRALEAAGLPTRRPGDEPRSLCKRGLHELTPENTWQSPSTPGLRTCRACRKARRELQGRDQQRARARDYKRRLAASRKRKAPARGAGRSATGRTGSAARSAWPTRASEARPAALTGGEVCPATERGTLGLPDAGVWIPLTGAQGWRAPSPDGRVRARVSALEAGLPYRRGFSANRFARPVT
jgi:hypothetical protein